MIQRLSIEDALENDRCGICGSVEHFREDHPPSAAVPDPADVEKVARAEAAQGEGDCPDCGHLATWHAAHGCLCCDCTRPGSYVHAPQPDDDEGWTPPATIGGTWTRLNRRTRLYESWPPSRPAALAVVRPSPDSEAVARVEALADEIAVERFHRGSTIDRVQAANRIRAALGTGDREGADRG